ncbi:metallophosphoesterase family protein [Bosea sp. MMO-172]|uniref:metallophosphoesterase family protein n=1 Tax=Bosea sp. MMO-172 TaxID=3127885 RepID=UPI00301A86DE
MTRIAVIADPHFHNVTYRAGHPHAPLSAVRSLADTVASTRVFNESYPALPALLDDIVARGIELVILVGDLTDDGQRSTMAAATAVLQDYSARHGLRFLATPGNHDLYAIHGRHQSKRFLDADGSHVLVTSDPEADAGDSTARIVSPDMHCGGYDSAIPAMAELGFFRRPWHLHWESPFGPDDALSARSFEIRSADGGTVRRMIDSSYLVEPVEGLWVLSIDANVFEPRDGDRDPALEKSYIDSTDAGWNAMPRNKPFVLAWMRDVAARAEALGKTLLAFSHYPVLDPLNGTTADEARLLGDTSFVRRAPTAATAEAAAATGLRIHFSGHLHINDTACVSSGDDWLINIAVPSMVGFPPAYKIATVAKEHLDVETVVLSEVPGFDLAFDLYKAEARLTGEDDGGIASTTSHGAFLSTHLAEMVRRRYLPKEWPADLAALVPRLTLADLDRLAGIAAPLAPADVMPEAADPEALPFFELVVDWYRLRKGRHVALDFIAPERLDAYRALAARYRAGHWPATSVQARIASFLAILESYLASLPSRHFSIDLATGAVEDRFTSA